MVTIKYIKIYSALIIKMSVAIYGWREIYNDRIVTPMIEKYHMEAFTEYKMCRGHIIYGIQYKISQISGKLQLCLDDMDNVVKAYHIYCMKYNTEDYEVELQEYIYGENAIVQDVFTLYYEDV